MKAASHSFYKSWGLEPIKNLQLEFGAMPQTGGEQSEVGIATDLRSVSAKLTWMCSTGSSSLCTGSRPRKDR